MVKDNNKENILDQGGKDALVDSFINQMKRIDGEYYEHSSRPPKEMLEEKIKEHIEEKVKLSSNNSNQSEEDL